MPADPALDVWCATRRIGRLRTDERGRLHFRYETAWLRDADGFAISISLPLHDVEYADVAHTFFANLLPEGGVRTAVCRRLGISEDNDASLLRAIGGECAGALSIVTADAQPPSTDGEYEALSDRRLQSLLSGDRVVPLLVGGTTTRLSLAGAQDKLPVALIDGQLHLPLAASPSTHILKLPSPRYPHIASNEAYVLGLGARIGLDVVRCELLRRTDPPSLLVERYDRTPSDDPWPVTRRHQEDLCQALGLPASRKYEQEGGPSLSAAIALVRDHVTQPLVDVRRVLAWQAFNLVAGNSDGHGKNLSLLRGPDGLRLAPFYDLLSTRAFPALDRRLAMGVGGQRDPDRVGRAEWTALAASLGLGQGVVVAVVRETAERCRDELAAWTREFREAHGDLPVLQTIPDKIRRRGARLLRALDA